MTYIKDSDKQSILDYNKTKHTVNQFKLAAIKVCVLKAVNIRYK